ncbi:MAG: glycosyltransferase family 4 protein [Flavobacteriales bacterium]|nr:glycosyltransferase family 4 protein [Flavobacteriales bacterium]
MKLVVLSTFYPFRGGIAQFNESMVQGLQQEGHEIVTFNFTVQYPSFLFPGKSQKVDSIVADKITATPVLSSINPLTWGKVRNMIKRESPDAVIVPYWSSYLGPALGSAIPDEIPTLGLTHNAKNHGNNGLSSLLSRWYLNKVDHFVCLSEEVKKAMATSTGKPATALFHPIYDHFGDAPEISEIESFRQKLKIDPNNKIVLFFGLIRSYKGIDTLVAAQQYLDDNVTILIVGERYESDIEIPSNNSNIIWIDQFVPDEEVGHYFGMADTVVLPYHSASQSGVTAIALHYDKTIVASDVGGLSEYIDQNKTGILVEPKTPKALAEGIQKCLLEIATQPDTKNLIAKKKESLSWKQFSKSLVTIVERTIRRN